MATNREYTEDFKNNVRVSLKAENIAKELLEQLTWDTLTSVRDVPEYFHFGDLLGTDGKFYDVKDDGVIHRSGNVFCETKKRWKESGKLTDGWMLNSHYDYLVILDQIKKHIYLLDFPSLKKIYRSYGYWRNNVDMGDNYTDGIVVSLDKCRKYDALIDESEYKEENGCYKLVI